MQNIIFGIEDVSSDEVILAGATITSGSWYEPDEVAEVSTTPADALRSDSVYVVGCGNKWTYITDEGHEDAEVDVYSIARRLAIGAYVAEAEMAAMHEWLTEIVGGPADKVWEKLEEDAQEKYNSEDHDHDYDPDPSDYM